MDIAMRVDLVNDATGEKLVAYCKKYFDQWLLMSELVDGRNEHYHIHGFTTGTSVATLRQQFRRKFPENSGNGGYELKECDHPEGIEGYLRYICKGDSPDDLPSYVASSQYGYDVEELHTQYWDIFEREKGKYDPEYASKKAVTNASLIAKVIERLPSMAQWFDVRDKPRVCQLMFDVWHEHGKILNVYQARSYYYEIAYKLAPSDDAKFALCQSLAQGW